MYWKSRPPEDEIGLANSMVCSATMTMGTRAIAIENVKTGELTEAVYEHPFVTLPLG